jgi:excisionase family DNA binding protein
LRCGEKVVSEGGTMKNLKKGKGDGRQGEGFEPAEEHEIEKEYVSASLLTVAEAANYLGVGRKIVYQLIEREEVTAVRAGGATLVEKNSLDSFRARGTLT